MWDKKQHSVAEAMEQAAISGLCRDGQIEIGCQTARPLYPDLSEPELLAIAEAIYKQIMSVE